MGKGDKYIPSSRIENLRDRIHGGFPGSRLEPLSPSRLAKLVAVHPTLPDHLRELLTTVGVGTIGDSQYAIQELTNPGDIYDAQTADRLTGVVLVGDNFAGVCEAYRVVGDCWNFGPINDFGEFEPAIPNETFIDFLDDWFGTPSDD